MELKTLINPKRFNIAVSSRLSAIQNAIPTRGDIVFADLLKGLLDGCVMQSRKGSLSGRGLVRVSAENLGLGHGQTSFEDELLNYLSGLGGKLIDVNNRTINFIPAHGKMSEEIKTGTSLRGALRNSSLVVSSVGEMAVVKKDAEGKIVEKTVIEGHEPHYVGLCLSYDA